MNMANRYFVYVIQLSDEGCPGKRRANPNFPCLYVGSTGKSPEEAMTDHELGAYPRRGTRGHTVRLRNDLLPEPCSFATRSEAASVETNLAKKLRTLGYTVRGGKGGNYFHTLGG